jgi:hypothetical protein
MLPGDEMAADRFGDEHRLAELGLPSLAFVVGSRGHGVTITLIDSRSAIVRSPSGVLARLFLGHHGSLRVGAPAS